MKVLVTGDRNWTDIKTIRMLLTVLRQSGFDYIAEGGAKGADTIARLEGLKLGYIVEEHKADWKQFGHGAGPIRNRIMYNIEKPDLVVAFHPDLSASKGTAHMIQYAKSKGATVLVIGPRPK